MQSVVVGIVMVLCVVGVDVLPRRRFLPFTRILFVIPFLLFIGLWIHSGFVHAVCTGIAAIVATSILFRLLPPPPDIRNMMRELQHLSIRSNLDGVEPPKLQIAGEVKFVDLFQAANLIVSFCAVNGVPEQDQRVEVGAERLVFRARKGTRYEYRTVYRVADARYLYVKSNTATPAETNRRIEMLTSKTSQRSDTVEAYQEFLRKYPQSEFAAEARDRIQKLQARDELKPILEAAKTPLQLERLVTIQPDMAEFILPRLEQAILQEIQNEGVRNRLVIPEFTPHVGGETLSATISVSDETVIISLEFPCDQCLNSVGAPGMKFTGLETYSREKGITNKFSAPKAELKYILFGLPNWQEHGGNTLGGNYGIHRFDGTIAINGYRFIGVGSRIDRLTFSLIKKVGYVYLRGKGKVVLKNGKEVKLGD